MTDIPRLSEDDMTRFEVYLTRREIMSLPIETRRRILEKQVQEFVSGNMPEEKDLLLRYDEIPNECVSDLFPMDDADKVAELFNRWGKNKKEICEAQNDKTSRKLNDYWKAKIMKLLDNAAGQKAEIDRLKEGNKELQNALECDASDLWGVTNAIKAEIRAREWIMEGRCCYAWNDDHYRDETRLAFEAVMKLIENVQHPAQKRFQGVIRKYPQMFLKAELEQAVAEARKEVVGCIRKAIYDIEFECDSATDYLTRVSNYLKTL